MSRGWAFDLADVCVCLGIVRAKMGFDCFWAVFIWGLILFVFSFSRFFLFWNGDAFQASLTTFGKGDVFEAGVLEEITAKPAPLAWQTWIWGDNNYFFRMVFEIGRRQAPILGGSQPGVLFACEKYFRCGLQDHRLQRELLCCDWCMMFWTWRAWRFDQFLGFAHCALLDRYKILNPDKLRGSYGKPRPELFGTWNKQLAKQQASGRTNSGPNRILRRTTHLTSFDMFNY